LSNIVKFARKTRNSRKDYYVHNVNGNSGLLIVYIFIGQLINFNQ